MGFDGRLLSGMSRAISRLEERIGIRLLDRTTRSLRLTGEGARLYELAAPHLSGVEEAANAISGSATQVRGLLRVSLNPLFARYVLAPHLPEFSRRFPEVSLQMVAAPEGQDLVADGIDVAVRFGAQPASAMSARRLLHARVLTVASPAYLQRHGRPRRPEDLAKHECIQFIDPQRGKPFGWEFHRGKEVRPVPTSGRLTLTDGDAMVAACVAGYGIAQALSLAVEHLLESGALVELFPEWPDEVFPLYAIRPSRRLPPAAVEAFLDFCGEICKA